MLQESARVRSIADASRAARAPEAGARDVNQRHALLGARRGRHPRRGSHTGPCHLFPLSSRLTYSSFHFCELLHCSLILKGIEEALKLQMRADQPENNRQFEFTIKQLHTGQLHLLLLSSSRSYFLWLSFTITIPSHSLYNSEGDETVRKNGAGEATAHDGADSDVEKANDEFDDEEQDGVEPELDLNEVVRTEAGERSGDVF